MYWFLYQTTALSFLKVIYDCNMLWRSAVSKFSRLQFTKPIHFQVLQREWEIEEDGGSFNKYLPYNNFQGVIKAHDFPFKSYSVAAQLQNNHFTKVKLFKDIYTIQYFSLVFYSHYLLLSLMHLRMYYSYYT